MTLLVQVRSGTNPRGEKWANMLLSCISSLKYRVGDEWAEGM